MALLGTFGAFLAFSMPFGANLAAFGSNSRSELFHSAHPLLRRTERKLGRQSAAQQNRRSESAHCVARASRFERI